MRDLSGETDTASAFFLARWPRRPLTRVSQPIVRWVLAYRRPTRVRHRLRLRLRLTRETQARYHLQQLLVRHQQQLLLQPPRASMLQPRLRRRLVLMQHYPLQLQQLR